MVRVRGTISEAFSISSGVRQGCVLAANLFNTATDRILNNNNNTQALYLCVNYDDSGHLITGLDCTDDVVTLQIYLFVVFDTLKDALLIFNNSKNYGSMLTGPRPSFEQSFGPSSSFIGTQPVTTIDNFTYIGSTIASNNSSYNDVNRGLNRRIAIATSNTSKLLSIWT